MDNKIAISAETTIDLTEELLSKYDIKTVPFTVLLGDKVGFDGKITPKEIIEYVTETNILPKTSAVNEYQYDEHFTEILNNGYDAIIHFCLSSELSTAYNNAVMSAKKFKNVYIIDSRSLSTGIALLAIYARKLADEGVDTATIVEKCKARIPYVQASFELNRVDYLYKGGRCSMLTYLGANLLRIRPQILLKDGKMVSGKKYKGSFSKVVENYCLDVLEEFNTPDLEEVFLTYTTADESTLEKVQGILKDYGFKNIHLTTAGATITSHCGENCLGILYINDGKH